MEVIGAGFGRTGTMSLKAALEHLGFGPCYHAVELFGHPEHAPAWEAASRGEPVDWHELFRDYRATVDWPAAAFYAELMDTFPAAKVILSVRDLERWYASAHETIHAAQRTERPPSQTVAPEMERAFSALGRIVWEDTFSGRFEDRAHAIAVHEQHLEDVRRRVPPRRLLVYELGQGWEPLAGFLEVSPPTGEPFPHLNDAAAFHEMVARETGRAEPLS